MAKFERIDPLEIEGHVLMENTHGFKKIFTIDVANDILRKANRKGKKLWTPCDESAYKVGSDGKVALKPVKKESKERNTAKSEKTTTESPE